MNQNFTPNQHQYNNMTPFKTWLKYQINTWGLNSFPFVESDFDDLTNYGMMMKLMKHFNTLIENQNMVEEDMTNLYNAFTELQIYLFNEFADYKNEVDDEIEQFENSITSDFNTLQNYVNNYFNNLDVQTEINNKLDAMVEAGTLQEIVADYLNSKAVFGYDNVDSMIASTNLINGSYAQTLGFYTKNDGGSSLYKIRTKTNEDVVNGFDLILLNDTTLVAEFVESKIVNIKQLGYINTMTETEQTTFLNYVFSKYKNILIKNVSITINDSLSLISDQSINLENSSILNTTTTNKKYIFNIDNKENIHINAIDSYLSFNKPETEQQACLRITNSNNIYCDGLDLIKAGGDGILISGTDDTTYSENINISNLTINNNRRNGISVIGGVRRLSVKNCKITNTSGTNPQFGIDLEPWQHEESRDGSNIDVIIEECVFEGNAGGAIDIIYYNKNLTIKNNIFNGNNVQSALRQEKGANAYPKNVLISNNNFNNAAIYLRGVQFAEYIIENNKFDGKGISTDSEADLTPFYNAKPQNGYLVIKNNIIKNSNSHGIVLNAVSNGLVEGNLIEKPYNRCISTISSNNVNIINNTFLDHAQNTTDTSGIETIKCQTTHNIKIDGNLFIDKNSEITFTRLILFDGSCQKLIAVNNNALNSLYTNFISKYGTITNEVIDNNLLNT